MALPNITNRTGPDQFNDTPIVLCRVNLRPHLRRHALLGRHLRRQPRLLHRMSQRLLTIGVLPHPHGRHARRHMDMVGSAHHHRIHLAVHLVQQLAIVRKLLDPGILRKGFRGPTFVHVAQGHNILVLHTLQIGRTSTTHADERQTELLVRVIAESRATVSEDR